MGKGLRRRRITEKGMVRNPETNGFGGVRRYDEYMRGRGIRRVGMHIMVGKQAYEG